MTPTERSKLQRRWLRSFLAAACLCGSLAGCHEDSPTAPPDLPEDDPIPEVIPGVWPEESSILIDYRENGVMTTIYSTGSKNVLWYADVQAEWCKVIPSTGVLTPDSRQEMVIIIDRDMLPTGLWSTNIRITSTEATYELIGVTVLQYRETLLNLDHLPIDVAYDMDRNRLVTISEDPDRLHVINPSNGSSHSYDLIKPPVALALAPGGSKAAVGHSQSVSCIDLTSGSATNYTVSANVFDVVLPGNGWMYTFSGRIASPVQCVDLQTGHVSPGPLSSAVCAILHRSSGFIHGIDGSSLTTYDIRSGAAKFLKYESVSYVGSQMWAVAGGTRLLASSRKLFESDPGEVRDLDFIGELSGIETVSWAVDIPGTKRTVLVFPQTLRFVDQNTFETTQVAHVPGFFEPEGAVGGYIAAARARWAFVNSVESELLLLIERMDQGSWAIAKVDLSDAWAN